MQEVAHVPLLQRAQPVPASVELGLSRNYEAEKLLFKSTGSFGKPFLALRSTVILLLAPKLQVFLANANRDQCKFIKTELFK